MGIRQLILRHQKPWERLFTGSVLIYTFAATFVVWKTMKKYGVNPYIFFLIDFITSITYGIASARLVVTILEKRIGQAQKWAIGSAISFITPQLYILISANHVPRDTYYAIFGIFGALAIFTIISLLFELRKKRKELEPPTR
jgi:hypothetical protein